MKKRALTQSPFSEETFNALPKAVREYINFLTTIIQEQSDQIVKLNAYIAQQDVRIREQGVLIAKQNVRINELESRVNKNSSNSGKPPSSDGFKKPLKTMSLREKSGKKQGGQRGRKGTTLKQVENPDKVIIIDPEACNKCNASLEKAQAKGIEKRQVIDIKITKEVTESRSVTKTCLVCGTDSKGKFPENVKAPVQYGERARAALLYLQHQHLLPFDRLSKIANDLFGIPLSPATLTKFGQDMFDDLEKFESELKSLLSSSNVLHADETGMRCNKKLCWLHVASNQNFTLYILQKKRGKEAMDKIGVIENFRGTLIHDTFFPYFKYAETNHALCNAHLLRELKGILENDKESWTRHMTRLLLIVLRARKDGKEPSQEKIERIENIYDKIVERGLLHHSQLVPLPTGKRGRKKQRSGKNLLDRFKKYKKETLASLYDPKVPFTNNQAEQDIRMTKLKQKISGGFRTSDGADVFFRIRSYISTCYKQGRNIFHALANATRGDPIMP